MTLNNRLKNPTLFFLVSLAIILLLQTGIGLQYSLVRDYVYYALGYGLVYLLGLKLKKASNKSIIICGVVLFILFSICAVRILIQGDGNLLTFSHFKYPPRSYFLIWGSMVSVLLYYCVVKWPVKNLPSLIRFIGSHTIWIYFYHIPFVTLFEGISCFWLFRYVIIYLAALTLTFLQDRLVRRLETKGVRCFLLPYMIG